MAFFFIENTVFTKHLKFDPNLVEMLSTVSDNISSFREGRQKKCGP